jgi:hypothetical protein
VAFRFALCVISVDDFKFAEAVEEVNSEGNSCAGEAGVEAEFGAELGVIGNPKLGGAEIVTNSGAIRARIKVR